MLQKVNEQMTKPNKFDQLITANTTLTASDAGKDFIVDSADDVYITLPAIPENNVQYFFHKFGEGQVIISADAADTIMSGGTQIESSNTEPSMVGLEGVSANNKYYIRSGSGLWNVI